MEDNNIYGDHLEDMISEMNDILDRIASIRMEMKNNIGMDPVEHCLSRIKTDDSMREKCLRKGLPVTTESALTKIYDAIGIRVVCDFLSDVYQIEDRIRDFNDVEVIEEKDYIMHVKPNGYRSFHLIIKTKKGYYVEIQLRTISMDTWAALEHHMKYKKNIGNNQNLIEKELKRCADELASTDVSMQTIRDMIFEEEK